MFSFSAAGGQEFSQLECFCTEGFACMTSLVSCSVNHDVVVQSTGDVESRAMPERFLRLPKRSWTYLPPPKLRSGAKAVWQHRGHQVILWRHVQKVTAKKASRK